MRVDKPTLAAHHDALRDAAGALFRARGIDGVSVADIARAAGLTHGAFYGHYPSKDAVAAEACVDSLLAAAGRWRVRAAARPDNPVGAIIDAYLTEEHRDAPEGGCVLSAIGQEAARGHPALAAALEVGAGALLAALQSALGPHLPAEQAQRRAQAILATMTGGMLLARALRADPDRSRGALAAAAAAARGIARETNADAVP